MTGNERSWGHLVPSDQVVGPLQWVNHARKLMADYSDRELLQKVNILSALVKVMERLTCHLPMVCGGVVQEEVVPGILEFSEAFRIYNEVIASDSTLEKKAKETFQNQVLHATLGLPVFIITHKIIGKFVVLKSSSNSIEYILSKLFDEFESSVKDPVVMDFSFSELKSLMSSDFDRKLLELAVSVGKSNRELEVLNIDIAHNTKEVKERIDSLRAVESFAEEKAKSKISFEISSLKELIKADILKLETRRSSWPEFAIQDLEDKIKVKKDRQDELSRVMNEETEHHRILLRRRVQEFRKRMERDERLRKMGRANIHQKQGAKRKLEDSDDEFVASMFSEHAGYHGLRNTVTEYIGTVDRSKRIKLEDIKKYYNIKRNERGQKNISTSTARRRLAPRRKTSQAAKSHIGKCLISVAVPPRTGDSSNENTHYARKFRSNIEQCLFSRTEFLNEIRDIESNVKVLFKSKDDAHYVAPGTKEGFDRARQKKIYCPADIEKRHGIPKYDFPDSTLYQTPGSHRILQKVPAAVDTGAAGEKLARDPNWDFHHVYIRPKITQDSSGLTWASEDVDLIINEPFSTSAVLEKNINIDKDKFSCLRSIQLEMKLFLLMQNSEDEKFIEYNAVRLKNLHDKLQTKHVMLVNWGENDELSKSIEEVLELAREVLAKSKEDNVVFSRVPQSMRLIILLNNCMDMIKIPPVRPIRVDLVDSGPGQAPGQKDVLFCDRLLFCLLDSNYYARVSLADHDSYMNYAERTNSAISDAMCVGTTIDCDIYNPIENLTVTEAANLDSRKFKELSFEAQTKNSNCIAQQLVQRVNGAPCLGNFITGRIGISQEDQFLGFLKPYIQNILTSSDLSCVPGGNFSLELEEFSISHSTRGQLYCEISKEKCILTTGEACEKCLSAPPRHGEKLVTVPQPEVDIASGSYFHVSKTDFKSRSVDDYLPRKNIDKSYQSDLLRTEEEIELFSQKFLVDKKFVQKRIEHVKLLEFKKELRKKDTEFKRNERIVRGFADYDWQKEIEDNNFKNLVVQDLKKYCLNFNLGTAGRKDDLKNRVRGHWFTTKDFINQSEPACVEKLGVAFPDAVADMIDIEEFEPLDSDSDEVINFEGFSSDSESSGED